MSLSSYKADRAEFILISILIASSKAKRELTKQETTEAIKQANIAYQQYLTNKT